MKNFPMHPHSQLGANVGAWKAAWGKPVLFSPDR